MDTYVTEPGTPTQDATMQAEHITSDNCAESAYMYSNISAVGEEGSSVNQPMFRVVPIPSFFG